jgi:phosphoserine phosphatase
MPTAALPLSRTIYLPKSREAVLDLWKSLGAKDAVCFDVDSTVIVDECIDELAEFVGVGDKVQAVTQKAMGGRVNFRCALRERLNIIRPSLDQLRKFNSSKPPKFTPGIKELIAQLHARKVSVYLVSGGFESTIHPVADLLELPRSRIVANKLLFNEDGSYLGFDETEPTSVSGGKALAVSMIKEREKHRHVFMIGDGATDAEACPPANAFIGFGGNVVRENVKKKCFYYAHCFDELIELLGGAPTSVLTKDTSVATMDNVESAAMPACSSDRQSTFP